MMTRPVAAALAVAFALAAALATGCASTTTASTPQLTAAAPETSHEAFVDFAGAPAAREPVAVSPTHAKSRRPGGEAAESSH